MRDPRGRANDQIMSLAAYERHQQQHVAKHGKPDNMADYEPGGRKHHSSMEEEDEFDGGRRRRRRTRRRHRGRRHTRKY